MTLTRILALVLGSQLFFLVSCTSALHAGIHIIARLDAREVERGDRLHPRFSVVVEPGKNGDPFELVPLSELPRLAARGGSYSLMMSKPSGRINTHEYAHASYNVLDDFETFQVIEVEDADDDNTVWSRYRVAGAEVTPLGSRMFYFGYMFNALPFAFGGACLLYAFGRFLRRRLARQCLARQAPLRVDREIPFATALTPGQHERIGAGSKIARVAWTVGVTVAVGMFAYAAWQLIVLSR